MTTSTVRRSTAQKEIAHITCFVNASEGVALRCTLSSRSSSHRADTCRNACFVIGQAPLVTDHRLTTGLQGGKMNSSGKAASSAWRVRQIRCEHRCSGGEGGRHLLLHDDEPDGDDEADGNHDADGSAHVRAVRG